MGYSEESIKLLIDSMVGEFAIYTVREGRLEEYYSADGIPALSGYTHEEYSELISGDAFKIVAENDLPQLQCILPDIIEAGREADVTYRIMHKDKVYVWVRARAKYLGEFKGAPLIFVMYSSAAVETDGYSNLLDCADNIVYVCDRETLELYYANQQALDYWGSTDYSGKRCYEFTRQRKTPCPWCSINNMKDGHYSTDSTYDPEKKKYYRITCDDIMWYGKKAVSTFATDITNEIDEVNRLQNEKNAVAEIVSSIPAGVIVYRIDSSGHHFVTANARAYDEWDIDKSAGSVWDQPDLIDKIHPDDAAAVMNALSALGAEKQEAEYSYRFRRKTGEYNWFRNYVTCMEQPDGSFRAFAVIMNITAEKEAESKLLQNRRMYKAATDLANLAVWIYDINKHCIIMSDSSADMDVSTSYSIPKVIDNVPDSVLQWVDENYFEALRDVYDQIDSGAPTASCEYWYKKIPGVRQVYFRIQYITVFGDSGEPLYAYGIGIDMTDDKLKEERYNSFYNQMIRVNPYSLGSFRLNLTTNWCGEGKSPLKSVLAQEESGTADGYLKANADTVYDPEIKEKYIKIFTRQNLLDEFRKGNHHLSMTYPVLASDGSVLWIDGFINMEENPYTGDVEAITYALNVTDRKIEEDIVQRMLEEKYDHIGLIDTDKHTYILKEKKWLFTDNEPNDVIDYDRACNIIAGSFAVKEDAADFLRCTDMEHLVRIMNDTNSYEFIFRCYDQQGEIRYKQVQYIWLDETRKLILNTQADITDVYLKEQEQIDRMHEALTAAENANRAKSEFLSRMSHDMRTPLNGIIGMNYLAARQDNPPQTAEYLKKIDGSSKFLLQLINDVLDMAKAESGKIELHPEPYPIEEFYGYIDSVIEPICREKNQHLVIDVDKVEGYFPVLDVLRINQIFFNLFSNAIKFTPEGGTIKCMIRGKTVAEDIIDMHLEISDTGIGMSREFQQVLFESFTQENRDENSEMRGSGLGLAIVKKLVDAMEGTVDVESEPGKGSKFIIDLKVGCVPEFAVGPDEAEEDDADDTFCRV
ncbi:MAG: ATP-binding protein [Eubacteriaceae bacterium]|jgi:signal transduction histidine kinase|nr:ATP-binding protein [Eubacteriaceae bacterium]